MIMQWIKWYKDLPDKPEPIWPVNGSDGCESKQDVAVIFLGYIFVMTVICILIFFAR
jgi:hypothetical protein